MGARGLNRAEDAPGHGRSAAWLSGIVGHAAACGLTAVEPRILRDGGNGVVWLHPHPVVARLLRLFPEDDAEAERSVAARELDVARHLRRQGVLAAQPTPLAEPGPHRVAGGWLTLWEYLPPVPRMPPEPDARARRVREMDGALATYPGALPRLGAWARAPRPADVAERGSGAVDIAARLRDWWAALDAHWRVADLAPAHGDAHLGNLLPGPDGWYWIDFEDASLMPRWWDMASMVAADLWRVSDPGTRLDSVMAVCAVEPADARAFGWALAGRAVWSLAWNLRLAQAHLGDAAWVQEQLVGVPRLLAGLASVGVSL